MLPSRRSYSFYLIIIHDTDHHITAKGQRQAENEITVRNKSYPADNLVQSNFILGASSREQCGSIPCVGLSVLDVDKFETINTRGLNRRVALELVAV